MSRTKGNEHMIADGPMRGWHAVISLVEHDVDAHEDLLALDLHPPGEHDLDHSFETYRHDYGWTVLRAGLLGQMPAVVD
jgi:hypothetical protein